MRPPAEACQGCGDAFGTFRDWRQVDGRVLCEHCAGSVDPIAAARDALAIAAGAKGRALSGCEQALVENAALGLERLVTTPST